MKITPYSVLGSIAISSVLLGAAAPSLAVTIAVDYSVPTQGDTICGVGLPLGGCVATDSSLLTSSSLAFDLTESQRGVNGNYDVSSFLSGSLFDGYQSNIGILAPYLLSSSLTANAIVQGGLVTDVLLNYGYSLDVEGTFFDFSFSGSSGSYGALSFIDIRSLTNATIQTSFSGTYEITQPPFEITQPPPVTPIPEPETYAMLLAGLAVLGFANKRRKRITAAA